MSVPRFKSDAEMSPADWDELRRTGRRPERPEFVAARRTALADAGLDEPDSEPQDLDTPEAHARLKYGAHD